MTQQQIGKLFRWQPGQQGPEPRLTLGSAGQPVQLGEQLPVRRTLEHAVPAQETDDAGAHRRRQPVVLGDQPGDPVQRQLHVDEAARRGAVERRQVLDGVADDAVDLEQPKERRLVVAVEHRQRTAGEQLDQRAGQQCRALCAQPAKSSAELSQPVAETVQPLTGLLQAAGGVIELGAGAVRPSLCGLRRVAPPAQGRRGVDEQSAQPALRGAQIGRALP